MVQHPQKTADFGSASLSRLPLTPPIVVQLIVKDPSGNSIIPYVPLETVVIYYITYEFSMLQGGRTTFPDRASIPFQRRRAEAVGHGFGAGWRSVSTYSVRQSGVIRASARRPSRKHGNVFLIPRRQHTLPRSISPARQSDETVRVSPCSSPRIILKCFLHLEWIKLVG